MSNLPDNPEKLSEPSPSTGSAASGAQPGASQQSQRVQLEVDDSRAVAAYANFCRVTGTPEELIIDFGLNPQPFNMPTSPIAVSHRIIINMYTAKRLLYALQMTVQRHEQMFGAIEIDVQKRLRPGAAGQP